MKPDIVSVLKWICKGAVMLFFAVAIVISIIDNENMAYIHNIFNNSQYVDGIRIETASWDFEVHYGDDRFDDVVYLFMRPLSLLGIGPASAVSNVYRTLQRESHELFATISFLIGDDTLFSISVYTFLGRPMPEQAELSEFIRGITFMAGDYYAVPLITNRNSFVRFGFDSWYCVEAILFSI